MLGACGYGGVGGCGGGGGIDSGDGDGLEERSRESRNSGAWLPLHPSAAYSHTNLSSRSQHLQSTGLDTHTFCQDLNIFKA